MTFTPERIAQLREILAKSTPGPWVTDPECEHQNLLGADDLMVADCAIFGFGEVEEARSGDQCEANASAIVTAVNTLAAALDKIEKLSAERDSLIDQVKAMTGVSAELSRVTAERDEAVGLLSGLIVGKDELALDRLCKAQARSFLSRVAAERDSLIDQVRAMSGVSATLSRVTAERDEAVRVMEPFARAVEKADGRARGSGFAPSFDIYRTLWEFSFGELRAARSFIARMEGRK